MLLCTERCENKQGEGLAVRMISGGDGLGGSRGFGQRVAAGIAYMQEAGQGYRTVDHDDHYGDGEHDDDRWKFMAADLDMFFKRAYTYYSERGYHCILVKECLNVLLLGFVNYVTMALLLWVDWHALLACRESEGCHDITPFVRAFGMPGALTDLVSLIFVLGTWAFWVVAAIRSWRQVKDAKEMQHFYHEQLGLAEADLLSIQWYEVVDEIVKKQKVAGLTHNQHDALDIANRIMRHDNYFIAMINCAEGGSELLPLGLGTFTVPSPIPFIPVSCRDYFNLPEALVLPTPPDFLSTTLYTALRWALLDDMFDPETFRLREKYSGVEGDEALSRRFKLAATVTFLASPFIVLAMTMYLVLKHAEKILRRPAYATERRWNDLAKWKFRWFNEMEATFDVRKEMSYSHADKYVDQFGSELLGLLARFLTFVSGSLAGLLLVICSINNSLMLTTYHDRDLWWFLGTFTAVLAVMRSVGQTPPKTVNPDDELKALQTLGFLSRKHVDRPGRKSQEVVNEIKSLYAPRCYNVLQEFLAIFTTPLLLWTVYPQNAGRILQFIRDSTVHSDATGDVCGYAAFDFDKYGDKEFGTKRSETTIHSKRKTPGGKMEQSFVSFKLKNPNWDSTGVRGVQAFSETVHHNLTRSVASVTHSMTDLESGGGGGGDGRDRHRAAGVGDPASPRGMSRAAPPSLGRSSNMTDTVRNLHLAEQQARARPITDSQMLMSLVDTMYLEQLGSGMEALEREHEQAQAEQNAQGMGGAAMPGLGSDEYFGDSSAGLSRPVSPDSFGSRRGSGRGRDPV